MGSLVNCAHRAIVLEPQLQRKPGHANPDKPQLAMHRFPATHSLGTSDAIGVQFRMIHSPVWRREKRDRLNDSKTTQELLADLEHEFWVPRHPVWLGIADGQHERHLRISGRSRGPDSDPVARGPAHRSAGAAYHRP